MATTLLSPAPRKGYAVVAGKGVLYILGGVVQKNKKDHVPGPSTLWRYCRGSARWTRLDPPPGDDTPFADAYLTRYGTFLVLPVVTRHGDTHLGFAAKVFDTWLDAWLPVQANAKVFDTESETWLSPPPDTRSGGVGGGTPSLAFRPYANAMSCAQQYRNEIACTLLGDRLFVMTTHVWSRRIFSLRLHGIANGSSTLPDWEHVYHLDRRDPRDHMDHLLYPIVSAYVGRDGNLWFSSHSYDLVFAVDEADASGKKSETVALRLLSPDFSRIPRDANWRADVPSVHEVVSGSPHFSAYDNFFDQYSLEIGGDIVGMSFRRREGEQCMEYSVWSAGHAVKWTQLRTPFTISHKALEEQRVRFVHAADTHEIWCVSSGPKGSSMIAFPVLSLAAATGAATDHANAPSLCAPATDETFEACLRALVRQLEDGAAARPGEVAIAFDDGVRIVACRPLLAAGSEYFRRLFDGPTADARAAELALPVPSDVGLCVLLLLHTGRLLEWPSHPESCARLVQLADYLRLEPHLLGAVHRVAARALTVENVRAVLEIANQIRADALRTACHRYMRSVDPAVLIAMVNAQCGGGEEEEPSAKRARA